MNKETLSSSVQFTSSDVNAPLICRSSGAWYCDEHVCMSVSTHISETTHLNFINFLCTLRTLTCVLVQLLIWRLCNTLCASGFVDEVMFSSNWPCGSVALPQQLGCNVVHGLTPLRHAIGYVQFWTTAALRLDESVVQGVIYKTGST